MKINKRKLETKLARFEKVSELMVYTIGDAALLLAHVIYLVMFILLGVKEMAVFNVFSVCFYGSLLYLVRKPRLRIPLLAAVLMEITVHACMGIYYIGWNNGFGMFMLFIMPVPFYMPLKKIYLPYLLSAVPLVVFVAAKIILGNPARSVYSFHDPVANNTIYFINTFFGSVILLYVASIYMFDRELNKIRMTEKNESLQKIATIDPLTELFNRRAMMDYLKLVQSSCRKSKKSYIIAIGDIDDFKKVNDTYGHEAGDEVLKAVSKIMADNVPAEGYVSRWGGEEFLLLIPSNDIDVGISCADKVRREISELTFLHDSRIPYNVTVTIGMCKALPDDDFEKVISEADKRLYRGKNQGKNCVIAQSADS